MAKYLGHQKHIRPSCSSPLWWFSCGWGVTQAQFLQSIRSLGAHYGNLPEYTSPVERDLHDVHTLMTTIFFYLAIKGILTVSFNNLSNWKHFPQRLFYEWNCFLSLYYAIQKWKACCIYSNHITEDSVFIQPKPITFSHRVGCLADLVWLTKHVFIIHHKTDERTLRVVHGEHQLHTPHRVETIVIWGRKDFHLWILISYSCYISNLFFSSFLAQFLFSYDQQAKKDLNSTIATHIIQERACSTDHEFETYHFAPIWNKSKQPIIQAVVVATSIKLCSEARKPNCAVIRLIY